MYSIKACIPDRFLYKRINHEDIFFSSIIFPFFTFNEGADNSGADLIG